MCYFITVGVQREGAARLEDERRRSPRAPLLTVMPAPNRSLAAMFPREDELYWIMSGGCSCGLVAPGSKREIDTDRQREARRRKGWFEAKVARSLRAMQRHPPRRRQEDASRQAFETLLATLSACSGGFRIFVHMYRSSPSLEGVPLGARAQLGLRAVLSSALPADTLIDVAKG